LILTGAQAEGATVLEAVAMETAAMEAMSTEPVVEAMTAIAPSSGTTIAPESSADAQVDPHPEASTEVVIRVVIVEDAALLRLAPVLETGSLSRGGLKLLDDDLIDPAFVSMSMESWRRTENWINV
jgi:hypothetical protein